MTIEIRAIEGAELHEYVDVASSAFIDRPDIAKIVDEVRPHWDLGRCWAAFDGGRIVGTARTWPTELTVPGNARIKASALTAVTVRTTHRRRGILRGLLAVEHAAARERDEITSILYASEATIYGRFGYGCAVQTASWTIDVATTGIHDSAGGRSGTVEFLPIDNAAADMIRDVFERWRVSQPGEIWRRPIMWTSDLGLSGGARERWSGFLVVHRDDTGVIDGYARYHGEAKWEHRQPRSTIQVDEMHGLTDEAQVALWRYLAGIDLVSTVRVDRRTPTDRIPWLLTNIRAAEPFEPGDGMWVRLHDIPAALGARTYERSGAIVLEVISSAAGAADDGATSRIRVALDAAPDGARAIPTDRAPDLTIDGAALGAAYLGGTRLRDAVLARGVDEHRAGALAEADALLATRDAPWCSTFF
ncbi:MAG: GNAT family N-acetyltransferase [Candidatus Limnocylindrales bacterium]